MTKRKTQRDGNDDERRQAVDEPIHTEREAERKQEDREFTPVILKRTDEALSHPDDILEKAIREGMIQQNRRFWSLLLSALAGGLILGFSAMAVAVVETQAMSLQLPFSPRLLTAFVYPLGFVICIMSGTQLFTEHTATAVYPFLDRRSKLGKLLRLWLVVIVGNMIGALLSASFLVLAEDVIQAEAGYVEIGRHLVAYPPVSLFFSAVLAGWLMAMGAWLVLATRTVSQIVSIYIVTFLIGLGGLHHSIAGSVEMFTAYLIGDLYTLSQVVNFVAVAIFGNLVGGSVFVALLNYGHIRETQKTHEQ